MACSYEKIGKYENARRWFKYVLEVIPESSDAYFGVALSCFKMKKYHDSVEAIEKAIEHHAE